jgi:hypothetical protein
MDAFGDHRELERREPSVPAQIGHVAPGPLGVPGDHLVQRRVPRDGQHGARIVRGPTRVEEQQGEVGQRVAERGHLPVEHAADRGADGDHVVDAVVTVHDRAAAGGHRHARGQPVVQFVKAGHVSAAGRVELLLPTPHLPLVVPVRAPEVGQAHGDRVDRVQVDQPVHQVEDQIADGGGPDRGQVGRQPVHRPLDEAHHVERRTDDLGVGSERHGPGHRKAGRMKRRDDAVLPAHVVRGGQHVPERRPAHDEPLGSIADRIREVGPAAGDHLAGQVAGDEAGHPLV